MAMLRELYRHLFKKRETVLYPFKELDQVHLPEGYRGKLTYNKDICIRCLLCVRSCPSGAIKEELDDKGRKKPLFRIDQCIFCGTCEEVCPVRPVKAVVLSKEYEIVTLDRNSEVVK
jgi:formate hydrogenlyase subunit 6/NADH:ubiquinone oxidoreductase subunit I